MNVVMVRSSCGKHVEPLSCHATIEGAQARIAEELKRWATDPGSVRAAPPAFYFVPVEALP